MREIDYDFRNILDQEKVQHLMDVVGLTLGVEIAVVSVDGAPIAATDGFYSLDSSVEQMEIRMVIDKIHLASFLVGFSSDQPELHNDRERQKQIRKMLELLIEHLSRLGWENYKQKKELTERKQLEEGLQKEKAQLEHNRKYDVLTGLFSRYYFEEKLEELCQKECYPISIIYADMNNLKLMNDIFGHHHGDLILEKMGKLMSAEAKPSYIIGRLGGDEFNIVIPYAKETEAEEYCKRIEQGCRSFEGSMLLPSIAMGWRTMESSNEKLKDVIRQADKMMYITKARIKQNWKIERDILEILYKKKYLFRQDIETLADRIRKFAEYMHLEEEKTRLLMFSAKIQDIGLIAVPEAVVKKSDGWTPEERAEMEKHTEIGYRLAKYYEEGLSAMKIILQSHERWDGLGYPNHLKGNEILYEAKVLYMVTTYSCWIDRKQDREGMDIKKARELLKNEAGRQFDPVLTEQFLCYLEKEEPIE